MSSELDILEKIELYTRGRLNQAEAAAFEAQMKQDPQLEKRVLASSIVDEIVVSHEALKLKERMQKDMAEPSVKWGRYVSAFLLVAAVGGGGLYLLRKEKEPQTVVQEKKPTLVQKQTKTEEEKTPLVSSPSQPTKAASQKRMEKEGKATTSIVPQEELVPKTVWQEKTETVLPQVAPVLSQNKETEPRQVAKSQEPVVVPCKSTLIEVEYASVPSCAGRETGELHIRAGSVKNGTPPFTFLVAGRSAASSFEHLAPGSYRLLVKDAKGCTYENAKEVVVASKACTEKKEYAYNPEFDPSWAIPYDPHKEPKFFRVMDKGGKLFFQTAVAGSHPSEWKGESTQGLHLGAGLYFFSIEYADGSVEEGSIMVTQ